MKLLSVAIPCYNSSAYMDKCIDSLLVGGNEVEILIVDDGSVKDNTAEIADDYERRYPGICRAIHQENKGHGGAVNTGLEHATGMFFKVVDSDDWVDREAYLKILDVLRSMVENNDCADAVFSNYIYDNSAQNTQYSMHYEKYFPENRMFGWADVRPLGVSTYVLMHSIIYRTEMVRDEAKLRLPEHTFYVDNIYAFVPFSKVYKMYYINVDFYHYMIGRPDQSVNIEVMVKRASQQYRVNELMIDYMADTRELLPQQEQFMAHYLGIIMTITTVLYLQADQPEKTKELWDLMKQKNPSLYDNIAHSAVGLASRLPGTLGHKLIMKGYDVAQRKVGFN